MIGRFFRGLFGVFEELFGHPIGFIHSFAVSPLPRRYWGRAHGAGIFLSCMVQIGLCLWGLMSSYHVYSERISRAIAENAIEVAKQQEATKVEALPAMVFGAFTPLAFLSVSTSGRFLAYGVVSGVIRVLGYASDHPCGDPVLTLVDGLIWDTGGTVKSVVGGATARIRSRLR